MPEMPMQGQEAHKKKGFELGGLFGKKKEEAGPDVAVIIGQVNEVARRLRILESRYTELNRKIEVTEKNMLNERKRVASELKTNDSDVLDIKKELNDLKVRTDMVVDSLKGFAVKEDIEVIRKYVDLWEPVNFATREEVEKIVEEKLEEKGK
ncbi:hypothetical protein GOV06_05120 [Candidatus Woesearchaeota archaeon]|nr:hypothetical protein [Candidatus Woesearchaeota archaeon]